MRRCILSIAVLVAVLWPWSAAAQNDDLPKPVVQDANTFSDDDFEAALNFFSGGGTWAFRLAPSSDAEKEKTWKVLILRPSGPTKTSFQLGATELGPKSKISSAQKVLDLYSANRATVVEFLRRYADRVDKGELEAQLVVVPPVKQGDEVPVKAAVVLTKQGLLDLLN
jgi:hypothetical protein